MKKIHLYIKIKTFIFFCFIIFPVYSEVRIVRLPVSEVKLGKFGAVIQDNGELKKTKASYDEVTKEYYHHFTENTTELARRDIAIIGTSFEIMQYLSKNKDVFIKNDIKELPGIYIGFGKYYPKDRFYGMFPFEDFVNQLVENTSKIFTASISSNSEFNQAFNESLITQAQAHSVYTEFSFEDYKGHFNDFFNFIQIYDDGKGVTKFYNSLKNNSIKDLLNTKYILVISYLYSNEYIKDDLKEVGKNKVSFFDIYKKISDNLLSSIKGHQDVFIWRDILGVAYGSHSDKNKIKYKSHFEKQNSLMTVDEPSLKDKSYKFVDNNYLVSSTPFILIGSESDILNFFAQRFDYSFVNTMEIYPNKKIYMGISDYKYSDLFGARKIDKFRSFLNKLAIRSSYEGRYSVGDFMVRQDKCVRTSECESHPRKD
ncbi:MAG: hypothetical protein K2X69_11320 [Silvanigrellaceae bacterium]|nr:hypothetical protein [Silvanigrellaceae bacterium]